MPRNRQNNSNRNQLNLNLFDYLNSLLKNLGKQINLTTSKKEQAQLTQAFEENLPTNVQPQQQEAILETWKSE